MIFREHPLKDTYRKLVWGPGLAAMQDLPVPWELWAVRGAGRLAASLFAGKRRDIRVNMERALPSLLDHESATREAFATHFANQYVGFSLAKCTSKTVDRYLSWQGLPALAQARAQGRGVVVMHLHMGPSQLPLHALGLMGWDMVQVSGGRWTEVSLSEVGRWAADQRRNLEASIPARIHDGQRYLRPLIRDLAEGRVVFTACDGTGGGEELGRRVLRPVLGVDFPVPVTPAWLAYRSGAPLHGVVCIRSRGPGAPYLGLVGPEVPLVRDRGLRYALEDGADRIAEFVERSLARWPGDWHFWDGFAPGGLLEGRQ